MDVEPVKALSVGTIKKNGKISLYLHLRSNISSAKPRRMVDSIVSKTAK